jgi:zinc-RING finger domain
MKYAKSLEQRLLDLPIKLRDQCISYKKWKKYCKQIAGTQDCELELKILEEQCNQVDKSFKEHYEKIYNTPLYLLPFIHCGIVNILRPTDVLKYAEVNSQTVYKVCKRLMKTYNSRIPIEWLTHIRSSHKYTFMGSNNTTHIQVKLQGHVECPICLEDIPLSDDNDNKVIVFGCGHYGCMDCVLHYAGVDEMKGMWFNLLANSTNKKCPICRYKSAFVNSICINH